MRTIEILRQVDHDDLGPLHDLFTVVEQADRRPALSDHLRLDLVQGGGEGFAALFAWGADRLRPMGYAQLSRAPRSWLVELVLDPAHREELADVGAELLGAALDIARAEGAGWAQWWVSEPTAEHDELAASLGLGTRRDLLQLRRTLPLDDDLRSPTPLPTRAFVPGEDEDAWLEVNNRAFAGHPEQGDWDLALLDARMEEDWFDPEGFLLHEVDGRLAAFCWTKVHQRTEPPMGEIYVIGVDPEHHGRGLGRAMTLAGLEHLAARGLGVGMLHVDASNKAAMGLYGSLGFRTHATDRSYGADLAQR